MKSGFSAAVMGPEALEMGLVNAVVPLEQLEAEGCVGLEAFSPTAIRCLKAAFNAETDGLLPGVAGNATHLFYRTEEAVP